MKSIAATFFAFYTLLNFASSQSWQRVQVFPYSHSSPGMNDCVHRGDTVLMISFDGLIIHSNNFFNSFEVDSTYHNISFTAIAFPTKDTGYIAAPSIQGGLLKTVDKGIVWNPAPTDMLTGAGGQTLFFTNPDTGYAGSMVGGCFRTTHNAGFSWSLCSNVELDPNILKIQFINDSTGFVLHNSEVGGTITGALRVFKTVDYGNNWVEMGFPYIQGMGDFIFVNDSTIIISGDRVIRKSTDGGNSYTSVLVSLDYVNDIYSPEYIRAISFANQDTGFVAFHSSIYKTYDAGNTWMKTDFSFDTIDIFNGIEFIKAVSSTKVFVGCDNGNIYKTETGGGVWSGIKENAQETTLLLYPNPATNQLTLTTTTALHNPAVTITTTTGSVVMQTTLTNPNKNELDISPLPAGLYFLSLYSEGERVVRRFLKTN